MSVHIVFEITGPAYIATADSARTAAELIEKQTKRKSQKTADLLADFVRRATKVISPNKRFTVETPEGSFSIVSAVRGNAPLMNI